MWFRKFFVGVLLVCVVSVNLWAEEEVAVTEDDATSFVNNVGKPSVEALVENFEKLFGDGKDNPAIHFIEGQIQQEIVNLVYGTITTLGISTVQHNITEEFLMLTTKGVFKEVVGGTTVGTLATQGLKKGVTSISKGMIIGIVTDIAKGVIEKVVYKTTKSRVLAGSAVALVEQGVLLFFSGGNPHKILVAEATLLASRIWDISSALVEIDKIQNQTAKNGFNSDLTMIQIKYSKEFSKSTDKLPSQNLIERLNKEVDDRVKFYSDEIDLTEGATAFKEEIYSHLVAHKLVYRYIYLNHLKKNRDEKRYFKYLNDYFTKDERSFYQHKYSFREPFYSDIDIYGKIHADLLSLMLYHRISYVKTTKTLTPIGGIKGEELKSWFRVLIKSVEKLDGKTYNKDIFMANDTMDITYIDFARAVDALYKEIYKVGENRYYDSCFATGEKRARTRLDVSKKLKELGYDIEGDNKDIYLSLTRYYSLVHGGQYHYMRIKSFLHNKIKRKLLIFFGAKFLSNHKKNRILITSCKE